MLLIVQFRHFVKYINVDCEAGSIPSWKDFHFEVVKRFPELKGTPYTVKDEDGIEVDEDIFPLVVSPRKKFTISLEEPPKYEPPKYEQIYRSEVVKKSIACEETRPLKKKKSINPFWVGLGAVAGAVGAVVAAPLVLTGLCAVAGAVGAVVAALVVLSTAGFTSAGIAAGSLAASIMSASGPIAAGSAFATLQSIGAAGMGAASMGAAAAAGAAVGGGATAAGVALSKKK